MNWFPFAILAGTSYGVYNFFTKITADKFSPTVSLMIITGTAFIVSVIGTLILRALGFPLLFDKSSIHRPILSGIFYGTAVIFYVIMFSKGAPLSLGNPLVSALLTVVVTTLSLLFLHESLNPVRIAGLGAVIIGFFILARS